MLSSLGFEGEPWNLNPNPIRDANSLVLIFSAAMFISASTSIGREMPIGEHVLGVANPSSSWWAAVERIPVFSLHNDYGNPS